MVTELTKNSRSLSGMRNGQYRKRLEKMVVEPREWEMTPCSEEEGDVPEKSYG